MSKSEIEFSAENAQKLGNLISRSALIKTIHKHHYRLSNAINTTDYGMFTVGIEQAINEAPAVDAVSREVVEQIMWERDTAMEQLKEHGIPFGGVAPDVVKVCRCKDCKYYESTHYGHMCKCWEDWLPTEDDDFCSYGPYSENIRDIIKRKPDNTKKAQEANKVCYALFKDGEVLMFDSEKAACEYLGVVKCSVASCFRKGYKCKGYKIAKMDGDSHEPTEN